MARSRKKKEDPRVTWVDKPKEERRANSRNNHCVSIDGNSYEKFCENCGKRFDTVNTARKLCDACWDEKCTGNGFKKLLFVRGGGSYTPTSEEHGVKIVDFFDDERCSGGRVVIKQYKFKNTEQLNPENKDNIPAQIAKYYAHCLTCGDVTGWYLSSEEAKHAFLSGKTL